jgi:hypothetical protein
MKNMNESYNRLIYVFKTYAAVLSSKSIINSCGNTGSLRDDLIGQQ